MYYDLKECGARIRALRKEKGMTSRTAGYKAEHQHRFFGKNRAWN